MKKLLLALFLLVPVQLWAADSKVTDLTEETTPASTDILYIVDDPSGTPTSKKVTAGNLGQAILIPSVTVATLPTPTTGMIRAVTDGSSSSDCETGSGSTVVVCFYNGTDWVSFGSSGGTEVDTLDTVFDRGKIIDGANSAANAFQVGNGTIHIRLYCDGSNICWIDTDTAADIRTVIQTNQTWCLYDLEGTSCIETVDPDGASTNAIWQYASAYRPKKSIWFGAGSLSTDGTQCAAPAEVTPVASGPKVWSIICADNAASTIYGSVRMPDSWDGGTVTFTHVYQQTAADTGILNGDISCQARSNGEAPSSTYGTAQALDDAAVVGSGSNDMTTSAAVTCAGTGVAGGDMLYFKYVLDTATTSAVATLHHLGFNLEYSVSSRSD